MGMLLRRDLGAERSVPTPTAKVEKFVEPVIEVREIKDEQPTYNRSDIMTMPTAKLQALAKELGIENADKTSGNKLKPIIIKELGL